MPVTITARGPKRGRILVWTRGAVTMTAPVSGRNPRPVFSGENNAWLHTPVRRDHLRTLLRHGLTRRDGSWALA